MKIDALLEKYELSGAALSKQLGYTGAESVNSRRRRDEDVPEIWYPRLKELGYEVDGWVPPPDTPTGFRDEEREPVPQPGAPQAPSQLPPIDYGTIAGYVEGAYKLSAEMAIRQADPLLADVINEHAAQAGQAWARWVESEPKVAALLQRLMVGTPLGEVIGVHVAIVFSYTLARTAARSIDAERAAAAAASVASDGTPEETPEDLVA